MALGEGAGFADELVEAFARVAGRVEGNGLEGKALWGGGRGGNGFLPEEASLKVEARELLREPVVD